KVFWGIRNVSFLRIRAFLAFQNPCRAGSIPGLKVLRRRPKRKTRASVVDVLECELQVVLFEGVDSHNVNTALGALSRFSNDGTECFGLLRRIYCERKDGPCPFRVKGEDVILDRYLFEALEPTDPLLLVLVSNNDTDNPGALHIGKVALG